MKVVVLTSGIWLLVVVVFFHVRLPVEAVTPMLMLNFSGTTLYTKPIANEGVSVVVKVSVFLAVPPVVTVSVVVTSPVATVVVLMVSFVVYESAPVETPSRENGVETLAFN